MAGAAICPPAPASAGHADAPRAVGGREAQPAGPSPPSVSINAGPWGWPCSQTLVTPKSSPGQHRSLQLQAKVQVPRHHNVDVLKEGGRPGLFPRDPEHTPAVRRNPRDSPPPRRSGLPPPPPAEEGQPFSGTVQPASSEERRGPLGPSRAWGVGEQRDSRVTRLPPRRPGTMVPSVLPARRGVSPCLHTGRCSEGTAPTAANGPHLPPPRLCLASNPRGRPRGTRPQLGSRAPTPHPPRCPRVPPWNIFDIF